METGRRTMAVLEEAHVIVMNRLGVAFVLAGLCAACGGGSTTTSETPAGAEGAAPAAGAPPAAPVPVVREFTVPDGTQLKLDLVTPLASDSSKVEDAVRATLRQAVAVDGTTVLPVGTELTGTVTEAAGSGRVKGRARLGFRFSALRAGTEGYRSKQHRSRSRPQPPRRKTPRRSGSAPASVRRLAPLRAAGAAPPRAQPSAPGAGPVSCSRPRVRKSGSARAPTSPRV